MGPHRSASLECSTMHRCCATVFYSGIYHNAPNIRFCNFIPCQARFFYVQPAGIVNEHPKSYKYYKHKSLYAIPHSHKHILLAGTDCCFPLHYVRGLAFYKPCTIQPRAQKRPFCLYLWNCYVLRWMCNRLLRRIPCNT